MTDEITNEPNEQPVEEKTVVDELDYDGLSNRAALEKATEIHREEKPVVDASSTRVEIKQAVEEEAEPPAEFNKEAKEAWKRKDIPAIQKEYRRIHDSRTAEIKRVHREAAEARKEGNTWREIGKMAAPYIEARGAEGVTPDKAIMEALALVNEFKKADPATVKAELKRIGIDLDAASPTPRGEADPTIKSLLEFREEYKKEREEQNFQKTAQTFEAVFKTLTSQKTRTGETVFPDLLDDSESGLDFARNLGSLTQDPRFQAGVVRRFPDADFNTVVVEAYKYLGGKVSGEPVRASQQNTQQHLQKSRRAAAATPGRTAPRVNDQNLNGKLSNRAALIKALELHREH